MDSSEPYIKVGSCSEVYLERPVMHIRHTSIAEEVQVETVPPEQKHGRAAIQGLQPASDRTAFVSFRPHVYDSEGRLHVFGSAECFLKLSFVGLDESATGFEETS